MSSPLTLNLQIIEQAQVYRSFTTLNLNLYLGKSQVQIEESEVSNSRTIIIDGNQLMNSPKSVTRYPRRTH